MKAKYIGTCDIPAFETIGEVWRSAGFYDEDSAECGAWLFEPNEQPEDDDGMCYYVSTEDLEFLPD